MKKSLMVLGVIIVLGLVIWLTYALSQINTNKNPNHFDPYAPVDHTATSTGGAVAKASTTIQGEEAPDAYIRTRTECAASLKAQTIKNGTEYAEGSILVSYKDGVTLASAKHDLDLSGYTYSLDTRGETKQVWGTVNVKSGQEFVEICTFKEKADITYAGINPILDLHE